MNYKAGQVIYYDQEYKDGTIVKLLSKVVQDTHREKVQLKDLYVDPKAEEWYPEDIQMRTELILNPVIYPNLEQAKLALPELFI